MDDQALLLAARAIVRRNLTDQVAGATMRWRSEISEFVLRYYCDASYGAAEEAECELSITELLAEFPEIRHAQAQCRLTSSVALDVGELWVFQRQ